MRRYWPLLALLASRLWAFHAFRLSAEDAYITFHASQNPEWMKAATSPVWACVLALWQPSAIARLVTLAADLLACGVALSKFTTWGGLAFCAFWCTPFMVGSAVSGLETHLVADALVCSLRWPLGFSLACLRPDACLISLLAAGKRWRYAALAILAMLVANLMLAGHFLPQTLGSKLSTYGVHWFKGWYWSCSEGLDILEWPLILAAVWGAWRTGRWAYLLAALAPLVVLWALGVPNFWWYAVPPVAILAALACERLNRVGFVVAVALIGFFWYPMNNRLTQRRDQEERLWDTGLELRKHHPSGTVFLEPLGMIPYLNPNLRVVDEIGLIEPWVAERRAKGDGWMTDALKRYKPEWLLVRTRFLRFPLRQFTGRSRPFRDEADLYRVLDRDSLGYWIVDIATIDGVRVRYQSCDFAILERKDLMPGLVKPVKVRIENHP